MPHKGCYKKQDNVNMLHIRKGTLIYLKFNGHASALNQQFAILS